MSKSLPLLSGFAALFLLSSCGLVVVDGFNSNLNRLSEEEKARVLRTEGQIASLPCDSNVYIVSGAQIQDCIQQHDSCMVYDWYPACSGCITPGQFEQCCDSMGYYPIIVMSCFCYRGFNRIDARHSPILFPNLEAYQTNRVYKYMESLCKSLTEQDEEPSDIWQFKHGKFERFLSTYRDETGTRLVTLDEFDQLIAMKKEAEKSAKQKKSGK